MVSLVLSVPTVEQQADLVEQQGLETLLFCRNSWATRHRFTDEQTGETIRARCDSWRCPYCGPRKVDQWRQLIKLAEPTLFITFTRVGHTVEEASRVLTTIMQFLRRGSKGKGPNRVGARPAYAVEWFAVLERHADFERVGFHWHVLVNQLEHIPHEHLKAALISATKGLFAQSGEKPSEIVHVERVRSGAVGYVTKYLTKGVTAGEQGRKQRKSQVTRAVVEIQASHIVTRQVMGPEEDEQVVTEERPYLYVTKQGEDGKPLFEVVEEVVERVSKARRIRYSRRFFPLRVEELRRTLFAGRELEEREEEKKQQEEDAQPGAGQSGRSRWVLHEMESYTPDVQAYEQRRRKLLVEALEDVRDGRRLSRRVINVWAYQQNT